MDRVQFHVRCSKQEWKLLKQAAAESGMSLSAFVIGAGKLLAVLSLHKEAEELVARNFAERVGSLLENIDDKLGGSRRVKTTG